MQAQMSPMCSAVLSQVCPVRGNIRQPDRGLLRAIFAASCARSLMMKLAVLAPARATAPVGGSFSQGEIALGPEAK
jgi:hypothetical protein